MEKEKKILRYEKPEVLSMDRIKQLAVGNCNEGKVAVFKPGD